VVVFSGVPDVLLIHETTVKMPCIGAWLLNGQRLGWGGALRIVRKCRGIEEIWLETLWVLSVHDENGKVGGYYKSTMAKGIYSATGRILSQDLDPLR
jgi:hypothetical protein